MKAKEVGPCYQEGLDFIPRVTRQDLQKAPSRTRDKANLQSNIQGGLGRMRGQVMGVQPSMSQDAKPEAFAYSKYCGRTSYQGVRGGKPKEW